MTITPFTVQVDEEDVARLKRKISDTVLPDDEIVEGAGWEYGVDLKWLKEMRDAWLELDWRAVERDINALPQFKTSIDGVELHFVHAASDKKDAIPIVLLHGWPSTFYEFYKVVEPLRSPQDDSWPAFHVIIPSVPGFGFSSTPRQKGWTVKDSARIINTLMTDLLGFKHYLAQGGDWGSLIATHLSHYPACELVHLNMCVVQPPNPIMLGLLWLLPSWMGTSWLTSFFLTEQDTHQLKRTKDFVLKAGYFFTQAAQPMQIGLALNDNPVGLLIWIGSKFHEHVDPTFPFPKKELLTTLSIYFFTHTFASSCLPYCENSFKEPLPKISDAKLGVSIFNHDILIMPKSWVKSYHKSFVFHQVHEKGGHFPSLDNPDGLVGDLRTFARDNKKLFVV